MKIIDGSLGEGGGQILRSTLSLSVCTGTPVRIENIRAGRRKSGLLRQHLACVRGSKEISNAKVLGDELGSLVVEFHPGKIQAGHYDFSIGSAGSTSLLFQTVLPALLFADEKSIVSFSGGTHNDLAPSFDFIKYGFLSMLGAMNINVSAKINAYGFMPKGGGQWTAEIEPATSIKTLNLKPFKEEQTKQAIVTQSGISRSVAERELEYVKNTLDWNDEDLSIKEVESEGAGNILSLRVSDGENIEIVDSIGSKRLSAEKVADRAVRDIKKFLRTKAAVGEYLCDQLLLPMALGNGGSFTTVKPSLHTLTNIDVIKEFIECHIHIKEINKELYEVCITN